MPTGQLNTNSYLECLIESINQDSPKYPCKLMLTNRHIRIGFAILVSMVLHGTFMLSSMNLKLPGKVSQQQKKSVTMTMASRPIHRPHVPASIKKEQNKPIIQKVIKEIPAPTPFNSDEKTLQEGNSQKVDDESLTASEEPETKNEQDSPNLIAASGDKNIIEATPLYKNNPPPNYPSTARRRGYQGTVTLEVMVTESGSVQKINIFKSSGYTVLDKAAIKAVKNWGFSPATRFGNPMAMWVKIPVQFVLQ